MFASIFGRRTRPAPTPAVPAAVRALQARSPNPSPPAPVEPHVGKPLRLALLSDIPAYSEILTASNGRFPLAEKHHGDLAAVATGEQRAALVVSERYWGNPIHLELVQQLRDAGVTVTLIGTADYGLLSAVYSNAREALERGVESAVMRRFDELVERAMALDASDIHIERRDDRATVKLRRNGVMVPHSDWSVDYAMTFVRAVHAMADSDSKETTFSESEGQAMSVSRTMPNGDRVKLRVQTEVAYPDGGMDIVMRVLRVGASFKARPMSSLGYTPGQIDMLSYMLSSPSGVVIFAGTTGSGKSTSLQTMMAQIRERDSGLKMYSVEDPPEYVLHGVTQIPVTRRRNARGEHAENPFARTMRNTMRMDPDVIMVGEVRDPESAACLVAMVQSGHKVLATLHAASVFAIPERMERLGVDVQTMASRGFISGLVCQTLVPVLCRHCRVQYGTDLELPSSGIHERIRAVAQPYDPLHVQGPGCEHCDGLGIAGRTVCAEMMIPDNRILEDFRSGRYADAYEYWRAFQTDAQAREARSTVGMTALDHAILKMRAGEVSPVDVERSLGLLTGYRIGENLVSAEAQP